MLYQSRFKRRGVWCLFALPSIDKHVIMERVLQTHKCINRSFLLLQKRSQFTLHGLKSFDDSPHTCDCENEWASITVTLSTLGVGSWNGIMLFYLKCASIFVFSRWKLFFSGQLMIFQISRMHTKRKQTNDSMRINNKDFMKTIFAIHWDDGNYAHRLFLYFKLYTKAINLIQNK